MYSNIEDFLLRSATTYYVARRMDYDMKDQVMSIAFCSKVGFSFILLFPLFPLLIHTITCSLPGLPYAALVSMHHSMQICHANSTPTSHHHQVSYTALLSLLLPILMQQTPLHHPLSPSPSQAASNAPVRHHSPSRPHRSGHSHP